MWLIFMASHVGKYTIQYMDPMGVETFCCCATALKLNDFTHLIVIQHVDFNASIRTGHSFLYTVFHEK